MNRVHIKTFFYHENATIGKSVTYPELWLRYDVRYSGAELSSRGMA